MPHARMGGPLSAIAGPHLRSQPLQRVQDCIPCGCLTLALLQEVDFSLTVAVACSSTQPEMKCNLMNVQLELGDMHARMPLELPELLALRIASTCCLLFFILLAAPAFQSVLSRGRGNVCARLRSLSVRSEKDYSAAVAHEIKRTGVHAAHTNASSILQNYASCAVSSLVVPRRHHAPKLDGELSACGHVVNGVCSVRR